MMSHSHHHGCYQVSRYLSHISQHLEGHVSYDHLIILSDDEESLLLQQQLTIRKKGIFNSRSREKAFVAEKIEKKVKVRYRSAQL